MDIHYPLQGILFEWDATKATTNFQKYQVSLETACEVFFDPFVYVLEGEQHDKEYRVTLIGMALNWNVLCVIYTERQGDIFRLISARPATSIERHYYEEQ